MLFICVYDLKMIRESMMISDYNVKTLGRPTHKSAAFKGFLNIKTQINFNCFHVLVRTIYALNLLLHLNDSNMTVIRIRKVSSDVLHLIHLSPVVV